MKTIISPEKLARDLDAARRFYESAIAINEHLYSVGVISAADLSNANGTLRLAAGRATEQAAAVGNATHFTIDDDYIVAHY